jgi:porphobilinogen synthase
MMELTTRLRRNRASEGLRRMTSETRLNVANLVYPLFVHGGDANEPVASMPGVERRSVKDLVRECRVAFDLGIPAAAIFRSSTGPAKIRADRVPFRGIICFSAPCAR